MPPPTTVSTSESWWSWFSKFQDEQRLERLQQCRQIEDLLKKCVENTVNSNSNSNSNSSSSSSSNSKKKTKASSDSSSSSSYRPNAIEEFSGGLRLMKYFQWRGLLKEEEKDKKEQQQDRLLSLPPRLRHALISSCARERHAVWACRGVAVGCGKELGALKKAFDEQGPLAVLHEPRTAYESTSSSSSSASSSSTSSVPGAESQSALGNCVRRGAHELLHRQRARKDNPMMNNNDNNTNSRDS